MKRVATVDLLGGWEAYSEKHLSTTYEIGAAAMVARVEKHSETRYKNLT